MSFHSVENIKDVLQYADHLKDYQLDKNILYTNTYSFALVGLGFLLK